MGLAGRLWGPGDWKSLLEGRHADGAWGMPHVMGAKGSYEVGSWANGQTGDLEIIVLS